MLKLYWKRMEIISEKFLVFTQSLWLYKSEPHDTQPCCCDTPGSKWTTLDEQRTQGAKLADTLLWSH